MNRTDLKEMSGLYFKQCKVPSIIHDIHEKLRRKISSLIPAKNPIYLDQWFSTLAAL